MATRGRKPKPPALRVVEGNAGKRPIPEDFAAPDEDSPPLERPKYLRKGSKPAKLFDEVAATCWWLGEADVYKLGMWCSLQAEFEKNPSGMVASRIGQLRALGSELGLDPASRTRLGGNKDGAKKKDKDGPASFFED